MSKRQIVVGRGDRRVIIGHDPSVVGTLCSLPEGLFGAPGKIPSDLVEFRVDKIGFKVNWLERCEEVEASGIPVIVTIRIAAEGGAWRGSDAERLRLFDDALSCVSVVDVELRSGIAAKVSEVARKQGKACIVSFHDFEKTPALAELRAVLAEAEALNGIVKIVTMVNGEGDVEILRELLGQTRNAPLCVMGMGPLGTATRVSFARSGSCLTYGYLDTPSAPGQLSAAEMVKQLRATTDTFR